jgi:hypothetical protein
MAELQRITDVNTRQIQACIREEKALNVELDVIRKEAAGIRKSVEEQAWQSIDSLVDSNKAKLSNQIT